APESHRGQAFGKDFEATRRLLCELVGAEQVQLLLGSGTLANDVVAGQLSLLAGHGLVLSNGEFGDRLIDQARRLALNFEPLEFGWGESFDPAAVRARIANGRVPGWLWAVHCETSTGVLNDLDALKAMCAEYQTKLCMDSISSIGTVPVDLQG